MSEQQMYLSLVSDRIGSLVLEFFESIPIGNTFRAEDVRKHVERYSKSAPGSADRVMRDLRMKGLINYVVINRKDSLYRRESCRDF